MGVAPAAPWEKTGPFSETPSETATPLRQPLKTVCVSICCFESFDANQLITSQYLWATYFCLCRGNSRRCIALQQTHLSQAPCFQPLLCLAALISMLQTPRWLQTHVIDQAWSSLLSWIQTCFCRLRCSNRNRHLDAWLGTPVAVFHTFVSLWDILHPATLSQLQLCYKRVCPAAVVHSLTIRTSKKSWPMRTISTCTFYLVLVPVLFLLASPCTNKHCQQQALLYTATKRTCLCQKTVEFTDFLLSSVDEGAGTILFCGNSVQAIRSRREKLRVGGVF